MIVRCGRCQVELEVAGAGEFMCPSCGTRNAVRGAGAGAAPPSSPLDLSSLGGGTPPGSGPAASEETPAGVTWSVCPECTWKFVHGESDSITCPNCRATLTPTPEGLRAEA